MSKFCIFPPVDNKRQLFDVVARLGWHFDHLVNAEIKIPVSLSTLNCSAITLPDGFDPAVLIYAQKIIKRIDFVYVENIEAAVDLARGSDVVLKCVEGVDWVDSSLKGLDVHIYRVDPLGVRQEGSFYIQAAFDVVDKKPELIAECKIKFRALKERIGKKKLAYVLATGPSVEGYRNYDFNDSLVIACNSTVMNSDLMNYARPSVLVFADPIFHFGVSQYAGKFREIVFHVLEESDIYVVVPFKYYPLLISKFSDYSERIIGVPFEPLQEFNFDVGENFFVKTTANILTLLLLPLATTFADEVRMLGCDGRPLENDDYFWGHGNSVQINDKMENIKKVHPGFFDIDYNEYYFEHCHTLSNLIHEGESNGKKFFHCGNSHIPALRHRILGKMYYEEVNSGECCVILEPDGIGTSGHYLRWHNQLIQSLRNRFKHIDLLCNKKQDPNLYECKAYRTFTSHSWGISRSAFSFQRNFIEASSSQQFLMELTNNLQMISKNHDTKNITIFMYYGSVQILKIIHTLRAGLKEVGFRIKVTLCLFHESVILDDKVKAPRFPPGAKEILLEGVAQEAWYRILSVTPQLSDHIYHRFGVKTGVLPNPAPGISDAESRPLFSGVPNDVAKRVISEGPTVFFPCSMRDEKGGVITRDFLEAVSSGSIQSQARFVVRGEIGSLANDNNIFSVGDNVSDDEYWENMRGADIIVIPYLSPQFKFRTSGIIVDALFAGKPCVVFTETWLGAVVWGLRVGLVIKYYSPNSIFSAISVITKNYEFFLSNAQEAFPKYAVKNSWDRLGMEVIA